MTILVDEFRDYSGGRKVPRCFADGSCHMTTHVGGDVAELHAFAEKLGLKREWFQPGSTPHYDLTAGRRADALRLGALFVPSKEQAWLRIQARKAKR